MSTDPLTGIHTREHLSSVSAEFAVAPASEPWSMVMIDVDHFKLVNDMHGHLAGDGVLRQVAGLIRSSIREEDVVIRFGGDEFLVILRGTTGEGALATAQRLVDETAALVFPSGLRVSISAGVAERRQTDALVEEMIERADRSLYAAKEAGRGRVSFSLPEEEEDGRRAISFTNLVGRRVELKKLRQLLDESTAYGSRMVILSGEAGVGKTRLVEEVERFCRFRRSSVLRGRCMEFFESQPYALLVKPLRERIGTLTAAQMEEFRKAVEPLHPATLELFPDFPAASRDDTQYFREERLRFRILEDISKMVAALASFDHTVLVLEDMQWITGPDLELLCFVIRSTTDSPILFLCTVRTGAKAAPETLERLLALRTSLPLLHLPLTNLDESEARNLVMFALHDPEVPHEFQDLLFRQSGGNPLFLREFLISLSESGCIMREPGGDRTYCTPSRMQIPDSLAEVIGQKLSRVEEEDLGVLRMASLTSGPFPMELLSSITGKGELEVASFLDRSLRAGILSEASSAGGVMLFGFSHDAIRSFLGESLPDVMRRALHQRMGAFFESLCTAGRDEFTTAAAFHFTSGRVPGKSAAWSMGAARQALRQRANREAIRWFESFLIHASGGGAERGDLFEASRQLGELYSIAGDGAKAAAHLEKALELADEGVLAEVHARLGDNCNRESRYPQAREHYARAMEAARDDYLRIEVMVATAFLDHISGDYRRGLEKLREAEALSARATRGDPRGDVLRALLYTRMGDITNDLTPGLPALPFYEEALTLCRAHGDRMGEARVLNNMSDVYLQLGDCEKALQVLLEVLEINERYDEALGVAIACFNIADTYSRMNQTALAREYFQRYLEVSGRIHNELGEGYGRLGLGLLHAREGNPAAAEREFREAAEVFGRLGSMSMNAEARMRTAQALVDLGRADEAGGLIEGLEEASMGSREAGFLRFVRGLLLLHGTPARQADPAGAAELLMESVANTDPVSEHDIATRFLVLAGALEQAGRPDEASRALSDGRAALERKLAHIVSPVVRDSVRAIQSIRTLLTR